MKLRNLKPDTLFLPPSCPRSKNQALPCPSKVLDRTSGSAAANEHQNDVEKQRSS